MISSKPRGRSRTSFPHRSIALPIAFVASVLVVGVPYWLVPYGKVSLPDTLAVTGLLVPAGAALVLRSCRVATFWTVASVIAASVPAAVLARVTVDCLRDPMAHNLWPLEIAIVLPLGLIGALVGAVAGGLAARFIRPPDATS